MTQTLYQTYLDLEVGDLVHVDYLPETTRVTRISQPRYVSIHGNQTFIYKYPRFTIHLDDQGWISQICFDSELGIYRTNRNLIRFEKPSKHPEMHIDMFASYLQVADSPYIFQDHVNYDAFYVWNCPHCKCDFDKDQSHKHFALRRFTNCPQCEQITKNQLFFMDGKSFQYCSEIIASLTSPESMHLSVISEHQKLRDKLK